MQTRLSLLLSDNQRMDLGKAIRAARIRKGYTQKRLGELFEVSKSAVAQWESGGNMPDPRKIPDLVRILELDPAVVVGTTTDTKIDPLSPSKEEDVSSLVRPSSAEGGQQSQGPAPPPDPEKMPRDVPVRGVSKGGAEGDFIMDINGDAPIDLVRRTPRIRNRKDVFALIVQGESMSPWREAGQLVYVEDRPINRGDYVVIELRPQHPGDPFPALLKRYVRTGGGKVILEQFKPARTIEIDQKRVRHIYRVMDWSELLGS